MRKLPGKERFLWDRAVTRTPGSSGWCAAARWPFVDLPTQSREISELRIFYMRTPSVKAFTESQPRGGGCLTKPKMPAANPQAFAILKPLFSSFPSESPR
jgi:hypothetical protein